MNKNNSKNLTKLWTCPKCGRKFLKKNQTHSCKLYPVEKHFEMKDFAKTLYNDLEATMNKQIGPFYVESLPCCIHFVTSLAYTFAAVYALRDRIRIHFTLDHKLNSERIEKFSQISKTRFKYSIDIKSDNEINKELINWLKQAYYLKKQ